MATATGIARKGTELSKSAKEKAVAVFTAEQKTKWEGNGWRPNSRVRSLLVAAAQVDWRAAATDRAAIAPHDLRPSNRMATCD